MKIIDINNKIIEQMRISGISQEMRSLESCEWIVVEEKEGKIIGVAGVGGLFHVSGIQIDKDFRGIGIGKLLQSALIKEAQSRGYSFLSVFNDPRNTASDKLHNSLGYETIFRIHYSEEIINDVKIMVFKKRGKLVKKTLSLFNSLIGMIVLALLLKILKSFFPKIFLYNEKEIPEPSIRCIIRNFEKI